ncbi:MAG: acyl-CoA dehydrogenase family protein [Ilumatobacter sp.]
MSGVLEAVREIADVIEAHADEAEQQRRLPRPTVDALTSAGVMEMLVPHVYGGPELGPLDMIAAIESLAFCDGAAGWCSMIASTTSSMSAFLPSQTAQAIYGDRSMVTGGVFAPNGRGVMTTEGGVDGVSVSGRWAWGSGTQHSEWIVGGAMCDDSTFRMCWFPRSDVSFIDTWHTGGMRGSGSLDYSVTDAFVPLDHTIQPGVTRPVAESDLTRFPNFTLLACGVASVGLGVGRRALLELIELAQGKKPQYSSRTLAENGYSQIEIARAEAALRAARAFLLDEVGQAWERVLAGDDVTIEQRIGIRLAATNAASAGTIAADVAFTLAGGTAVYDTSLLGRCMRDAHVVTQHIQTAPKLNQKIGRLLLGLDDDVSMF